MQAIYSLLVLAMCCTLSAARPRTRSAVVVPVVVVGEGETDRHPSQSHLSQSQSSQLQLSQSQASQEDPQHPSLPPRLTVGEDFGDRLGDKPLAAMLRGTELATRGITMRSRYRRSATTRVRYTGSYRQEFRLQGDAPLYLTLQPSTLTLALAPHNPTRTCFWVHTFEVLSTTPEAGQVVVLETQQGGHLLRASTSGTLSLSSGSGPASTMTRLDHHFFRLYSPVSVAHRRIKHIFTGQHLQARMNGVSLVSDNPDSAAGVHFQMNPVPELPPSPV